MISDELRARARQPLAFELIKAVLAISFVTGLLLTGRISDFPLNGLAQSGLVALAFTGSALVWCRFSGYESQSPGLLKLATAGLTALWIACIFIGSVTGRETVDALAIVVFCSAAISLPVLIAARWLILRPVLPAAGILFIGAAALGIQLFAVQSGRLYEIIVLAAVVVTQISTGFIVLGLPAPTLLKRVLRLPLLLILAWSSGWIALHLIVTSGLLDDKSGYADQAAGSASVIALAVVLCGEAMSYIIENIRENNAGSHPLALQYLRGVMYYLAPVALLFLFGGIVELTGL